MERKVKKYSGDLPSGIGSRWVVTVDGEEIGYVESYTGSERTYSASRGGGYRDVRCWSAKCTLNDHTLVYPYRSGVWGRSDWRTKDEAVDALVKYRGEYAAKIEEDRAREARHSVNRDRARAINAALGESGKYSNLASDEPTVEFPLSVIEALIAKGGE